MAVEIAEPNYLISREQALPNDARFAEQWALQNTGQSDGAPDTDIEAASAWRTVTGAASTVIAVIDSGIDFTHADLRNLSTLTQPRAGLVETLVTFGYGSLLMQPSFPGLAVYGPKDAYVLVLTWVTFADGSYYTLGGYRLL